MSTPAGAARYIIAADDKTKGAVASVLSGFRTMERGIKGTVSRINLALGLVGGVALKRALQNVFVETAKQSKEFAFALDEVKRSARNLLASKEGAPAATAAMRELAEVLKDPEVVAAADAITSTFIRGAAGAIKFAAGVKTLKEEIEELKLRREGVAGAGVEDRRTFIKGEPTFATTPEARSSQVFGINAELLQKQAELRKKEEEEARKLKEFWDRVFAAGDKVTRRFETMRQFQENIKFLEGIEKKLGDGPAGDAEFWEQLSRQGEMSAIKTRNAFVENMDAAARDVGETMRRTGDSIEEVGDIIGDKIEQAQASSVFVMEMQESLFGNVSGLLASAGDGADDFGVRMIDTFKKILADQATLALFKMLAGLGSSLTGSSGGAGFSGWVGAGLTALFGGVRDSGGRGQAGKGYVIGTGAQPEMFVPDSAGTFYPNMAGAGGGTNVVINMHNDFRGATQDAVRLFMARELQIIKQAADVAEARLRDKRRRRKF